ncbi:MAG: tetratricopeptide repeat protein [Candidatus Omnitrophica bacterium]|nr:tetratricopeptide repeat protein [Candidatus Omnitrophota bacterium]
MSFPADQDQISPLIEKGNTFIQQGNYEGGIAILETVLRRDPQNEKVLNVLLHAYDDYSQKLISENRFIQAQTYIKKMEAMIQGVDQLSEPRSLGRENNAPSRIKRELASAKAFMLNSPLATAVDIVSLNAGREHYNEAVDHFNKHQYEVAESLLKESIELDPSNPYAYELLGEIANLNHRLDEAEAYYKKAFSLNPDPKLREKYEKVIREKNIDKMQQQYSDEHFIIRYRRSGSLEGSRIREFLREAYRSISQDFGYYPKYKVPVLLYDYEEYRELSSTAPHWSGALFDGKIRLPVYDNGGKTADLNENDLKKLIYHELTHAFVLDLSQLKCPVWLNEGLAQYEENKIQPVHLRLLAQAVRKKDLIGIDELMFLDPSLTKSQEKVVLFYLQSFSFTAYLVEQRRFYSMKQLLLEVGKETRFREAFEKAFGRTIEDLWGDWQVALERQLR